MKSLEKIKLGKTNLDISRVVYGGIVSMNEQQVDSDRYVSFAIDRGVNYFDVAPAYGDAQLKLGNSLRSYRQDVILACKTGERLESKAILQIKESLELLHTDYFDVFQLHALTTEEDVDIAFSKDGVMNYLIKAKQEGMIRHIGFSAHNEAIAQKALKLYDFETILFPFNWALGNHKGMGNSLIIDAKEKNTGILALKSLALRPWEEKDDKQFSKCWYKPIPLDTNKDLAIAALKYTLSLGVHTIVPPGHIEYLEFVIDNLSDCISNQFSTENQQLIDEQLSGHIDKFIF